MDPRAAFTSITTSLRAEEWEKAYLELRPHLSKEEREIWGEVPLAIRQGSLLGLPQEVLKEYCKDTAVH